MTTADEVKPQPLADIEVAEPDPYDKQFWSVTTILDVLASPALEYWAIKETATAAVDSPKTIEVMMEEQGRDETIKFLCGARWRKPKIALGSAQLGTVVHALCENAALSGFFPTDEEIEIMVRKHAAKTVDLPSEVALVKQMIGHFVRWCERFQPRYLAAEAAVYNETYGYAGCLDAILEIGGVPLICDYKTRREPLTSKGGPQRPYGETALQLAAYRHAEIMATWRARRTEKYGRRYYLLGEDERCVAEPVPKVDSGICIIITPESCEAYPLRCDEEVFQHFLFVQESFRWKDDLSKRVVGDALQEEAE